MNDKEQPKPTPNKKGQLRTAARKALFLDALRQSLGIKTTALKMAGIGDHNTVTKWREKDPKFAADMDAVADLSGDFVETQLYKRIKEGDTTAIIFYCKTKLKNRGYTERTEITGADGKDLFATKTDAELDKEIEELQRKLT